MNLTEATAIAGIENIGYEPIGEVVDIDHLMHLLPEHSFAMLWTRRDDGYIVAVINRWWMRRPSP